MATIFHKVAEEQASDDAQDPKAQDTLVDSAQAPEALDAQAAVNTPAGIDRSRVIFGNEISEKDYEKACKAKASSIKRYGDDTALHYHLEASVAPVIGTRLGVRILGLAEGATPLDLAADAVAAGDRQPAPITDRTVDGAAGKPVVVGNIRMGFGHYRISMALASAARAMGYTPYWFDLCGFPGTTATKILEGQNKLYSMGSRLSQKVGAFNKLYWEPLNSEGFRQLSYNASDQKNAELFYPVYGDLPKDVPFVAAHVYPAQGAVHAGLTHVVNAIPDNWPMALHLAEGSIHTVQTPGAALGYRLLRGMSDHPLNPMPEGTVVETGHYIDHELVSNIDADCQARLERASAGDPVRYLICVGGAGAQFDFIRDTISYLMRYVEAGEATLMINVGDHSKVWKQLKRAIPELKGTIEHFNDFDEVEEFCHSAGMDAPLSGKLGKLGKRSKPAMTGIHAFCDSDIFSAVYSTNLLMRVCDVLVTKPSELAFYPVPKMMIRRVGGHEAWGAIRAAELGDGTYELDDVADVFAYIDAVQSDRSLVLTMCDSIKRNAQMGVYDGAYRVIELATCENE